MSHPRLLVGSRVLHATFALISCVLLGSSPVAAQTATATLVVEARDAGGALLPAVEVRLVNQASAVERVAMTTSAGTLTVPLLPAGVYRVTASVAGFKKEVVNDVRLEAGGKGTLDLVLVPGSFEESIVVSADAARLKTGDSTLGESFEGRLLVMMPVENRDFLQFTYQSPGAATPAPGSRLSTQAQRGRERVGRARGGEQLPARRRRQQRPVPQPAGRHAEPRCGPGVHARPEHLRRRVRPQRRRAGQRRHEVGRQPCARARCSSTSATRRFDARGVFDLAG